MQCRGLRGNGQNSGALTDVATRRRRLLIPLAVAALAAFVVGVASGKSADPGPIAWAATPRAGAAGEGQALYGTIVNRSKKAVRLRSKGIRVVDGDGKTLPSLSAFDGGYIPSYSGSVAREVLLRPGQKEPLSLTWTGGDGAQVKLAGSSLSIPQ